MLSNWIRQTTTTTGTGPLTLAAVAGYPRFVDAFPVIGRAFAYAILNADGTPVESGRGYLTDATTLVRKKVISTMSGGVYANSAAFAVNLSAGTYTVVCAADESVYPILAPDVNKTLNSANSPYTNGPRWIVSGNKSYNTGTTTPSANFFAYTAFKLDIPIDLISLALKVTTAAAGSTCGLAVYECSIEGALGKKLTELATPLDLSVTGMVSGSVATRQRLAPGWYFVGMAFVGSASINAFGNNGFDTITMGCPVLVHASGDWTKFGYSENKTSTTNTLPATPNPNDYFGTNATIYMGAG